MILLIKNKFFKHILIKQLWKKLQTHVTLMGIK
jgi:hypothetical protein